MKASDIIERVAKGETPDSVLSDSIDEDGEYILIDETEIEELINLTDEEIAELAMQFEAKKKKMKSPKMKSKKIPKGKVVIRGKSMDGRVMDKELFGWILQNMKK